MIPTTLGNLVGGGLFVGTAYWYLYLTGEVGVHVGFDIGSLNTAMEAGGPMRGEGSEGEGRVINGLDPMQTQTPQPGGGMMSALGKELSDDGPYAKTHKERTRSQESSSDEKV